MSPAHKRRITMAEIMAYVEQAHGVTHEEMLSEIRVARVARPRQIAMYLTRTLTCRSFPDIGRRLGGRDHTTILHGYRRIADLIQTDPEVAAAVERATFHFTGRVSCSTLPQPSVMAAMCEAYSKSMGRAA